MKQWIYYNGKFCKDDEALIPLTDRGFLFGDGVFTTVRVDNGIPEFLRSHFERLAIQTKALNIPWEPMPTDAIAEIIAKNGATKGSWVLKIIVTAKEEGICRGVGCTLAILSPYTGPYMTPCTLCFYPELVYSPFAKLKTLAYLPHLAVRDYARKQGCDEALLCTSDSILLEAGCSNLFWIDEGDLCIPDRSLPYLEGVILKLLQTHAGLPVRYVTSTLDDISEKAHLYLCNCLTHVRPVVSVNKRSFSRNPELEALLQNTLLSSILS